jgi:hypothetical protein
MQAQTILTYIFDLFFYFFSVLFIFEFLFEWSMAELKTEYQSLSPQQLKPPTTIETVAGQVSKIKPFAPESQSDKATLQYLGTVGADVNDFESIEQARQFLDEFAPWTVETTVQAALTRQSIQPEPQDGKLTFEEVSAKFTVKGFTLQRSRSGHNRYRVISPSNPPNSHRFTTLREALDWLAVSESLRV